MFILAFQEDFTLNKVIRQEFMEQYEAIVLKELKLWQKQMQRSPSLMNKMSRRVQGKINSYIPEKVHLAITTAIKQMVRAVLFGAEITTKEPLAGRSLEVREAVVNEKITFYKKNCSSRRRHYRSRRIITWSGRLSDIFRH